MQLPLHEHNIKLFGYPASTLKILTRTFLSLVHASRELRTHPGSSALIPRPSHFSACNIEKVGMGQGMRLGSSINTGIHFSPGKPLLHPSQRVQTHSEHS